MSAEAIANLRKKRLVYQLDATSLPGNSDGPIYNPETGAVIGTINAIHVHESKEAGEQQPTGISFAMPSAYLAQIWAEYMAKGLQNSGLRLDQPKGHGYFAPTLSLEAKQQWPPLLHSRI